MLIIVFGQSTIKEFKGGQGGDFLGMGRPIGNILNPLWVFHNSQYYDL